MAMTGGYGPTTNTAYSSQQQSGQNQNSFNRQQQDSWRTRQYGTPTQQSQSQQASVSRRPTGNAQQMNAGGGSQQFGQLSGGSGIQGLQSPVTANGQMSPQPLQWQSPQQQQYASLRQQQGTDVNAVPEQYRNIAQSYMTNLGRTGSAPEWQNWASNPEFEKGIAGSPEAAAYRQYQEQMQRALPDWITQAPGNINTAQINGQNWNPMVSPELQNPIYNPANMTSRYDFDPASISQFSAPNQQALDDSATSMLQRQFANPYTMSPEAVAALKAQQQETNLALQRSQMGQIASRAAARGTLGSGMQRSAENEARQQAAQNILNSYRDIDLEKIKADRLDENAVLNNANQFLNSQMTRAIGGYGSQLAGQTARERQMEAAALSGMQNEQQNAAQQWQHYQSLANQDAQNLGVWGQQNQNYFGLLDENRANRGLGMQGWLGQQGIGLDADRAKAQQQQFLASFLENRRQFDKSFDQSGSNFNNNLAYQYALLNTNNNNNAMDFYRSLFGAV